MPDFTNILQNKNINITNMQLVSQKPFFQITCEISNSCWSFSIKIMNLFTKAILCKRRNNFKHQRTGPIFNLLKNIYFFLQCFQLPPIIVSEHNLILLDWNDTANFLYSLFLFYLKKRCFLLMLTILLLANACSVYFTETCIWPV